MPFYDEGNRSLDQSLAIARYLGSKYDLLPSDPWDQAVLDAAALNIYDFWKSKYLYIVVLAHPSSRQSVFTLISIH